MSITYDSIEYLEERANVIAERILEAINKDKESTLWILVIALGLLFAPVFGIFTTLIFTLFLGLLNAVEAATLSNPKTFVALSMAVGTFTSIMMMHYLARDEFKRIREEKKKRIANELVSFGLYFLSTLEKAQKKRRKRR